MSPHRGYPCLRSEQREEPLSLQPPAASSTAFFDNEHPLCYRWDRNIFRSTRFIRFVLDSDHQPSIRALAQANIISAITSLGSV